MNNPTFRAVLVLALLLASSISYATTTAKLVPALGWDIKKQGGFPVSITSDPAGDIWVGTEGNGIWEYNPARKTWTQFTTADGLGDDCVYALAVDNQHRIWAGHLNHGVSVYNGDKWKNYGILDGPLGDRVFAITVSPKDDDVWIATDMGLARYSEKRADWDYYTRASGLPSDQIQSIAFDSNGNLYAATQCNGIASPDDDYKKWTPLTAPPTPPTRPMGEGLASNSINHITSLPLAGESKANIAILTNNGLSILDSISHLIFVRGMDWRDHARVPVPPGDDTGLHRPIEDWVTAIGSDLRSVWLGYRKHGVELLGEGSDRVTIRANVDKESVIIRDMLIQHGQPPLFVAYDGTSGGLLTLDSAPHYSAPASTVTAAGSPPPLPVPAPAPVLDDAKALAAQVGRFTQQIAPGEACYVADDWRTQGDWIGRYGSAYAKLCGIRGSGDQDYDLEPGYDVTLQTGPHFQANYNDTSDDNHGDITSYIGKDTSDDLRSLYEPTIGHRRDAEDSDGSFEPTRYPESYLGPDLWVKVRVPDGFHCLSLYFLNYDAHSPGGNKYRDFDVQVLPDLGKDSLQQAAIESGTAALARTRVTDFWGGVYKQFIVAGPASYVVAIGRNRSFCTKLQGVFIDHFPDSPDNRGKLPGFDSAPYVPPQIPAGYNAPPLVGAAIDLWSQLDDALPLRGVIPLQMPFRIWCYRAAVVGNAPPAILENWRWDISIWTPDDRKRFDAAIKAAHDALPVTQPPVP
jgi:hypothetical protein